MIRIDSTYARVVVLGKVVVLFSRSFCLRHNISQRSELPESSKLSKAGDRIGLENSTPPPLLLLPSPHLLVLWNLLPKSDTSIIMANYLASIFGTEQDKVNCSFYYKIGACRHGDRCSRKHVKPSYSQTILMPNMYQNPFYDPKSKMNPSQLQNHFDAFYEDVWCEMCKYGELEELVVCDNNNDRTLLLKNLSVS